MKNIYEELKEFWNKSLGGAEPEAINEKWIVNEKFNDIINNYVHKDSNVLDYACGSGWGLFEIYHTKDFNKGVGIDTSVSSIEYANKCAELSNIKNINFISGDENVLTNYENFFDFAISINLFDVIPDEVIDGILQKIEKSMRDASIFFIGLNPDFTEDQLINMIQMTKEGHYFFKNGILRANKKTIDEWNSIFSKYFDVLETFKFIVIDREKDFPRCGFLLKKKNVK